jgi:hypothetical protein
MNNWCICWVFTHILTKCTVQEAKSQKKARQAALAEGLNSGVQWLNNPRIYLDYGVRDMPPFILADHVSYLLRRAESFLEANLLSASQEISGILWNPKVNYRIHRCSLPVPILGQLDRVLPHIPLPEESSLRINLLSASSGHLIR